MNEQTANHDSNGPRGEPKAMTQVAPLRTPVQALRREQLLDALAALLREGALPGDPPTEAEAK